METETISVIAAIVVAVIGTIISVFTAYGVARWQAKEQTKDLTRQLEVTRKIAQREFLSTIFRAYLDLINNIGPEPNVIKSSVGYQDAIDSYNKNAKAITYQAYTLLLATNVPELKEHAEMLNSSYQVEDFNAENYRGILIAGLALFSEYMQTIPE